MTDDRDRELASLKREFQELREQQQALRSTVHGLQHERETFIDTIAARTPVSRRQVNAIVATLGITGAVSYLASEGVLAAGETWGSATGTIGPDAEPLANGNISDLDTQDLEVQNETFVRATRGSNSSATTSGTFINLYDGESKDILGEFSSSQVFNPDETGEYIVTVGAQFGGSTTDGDECRVRIRDTDASSNVSIRNQKAAGTTGVLSFAFIVNLTAGTNYEIQGVNMDSSFEVFTSSVGQIVRSVVA